MSLRNNMIFFSIVYCARNLFALSATEILKYAVIFLYFKWSSSDYPCITNWKASKRMKTTCSQLRIFCEYPDNIFFRIRVLWLLICEALVFIQKKISLTRNFAWNTRDTSNRRKEHAGKSLRRTPGRITPECSVS